MGIFPKAPRLSRRSVPGTNKPFYNTKAWKVIRALVIAEEPLCRECYKHGRLTEANQVDHIIPISIFKGDPLDRNNLQSLCTKCHGAKSGKEGN